MEWIAVADELSNLNLECVAVAEDQINARSRIRVFAWIDLARIDAEFQVKDDVLEANAGRGRDGI